VKLALLLLCVALTGCATSVDTFANRASCTLARDKALASLMWGDIGLTHYLDDRDAKVMCAAVSPPTN
jgi:hypothetical protein